MFTNLRCCHWGLHYDGHFHSFTLPLSTFIFPLPLPHTPTSSFLYLVCSDSFLHSFFWKSGSFLGSRRSRKHGPCSVHSISFSRHIAAYYLTVPPPASVYVYSNFSTVLFARKWTFRKNLTPSPDLFNHICRRLIDPSPYSRACNSQQKAHYLPSTFQLTFVFLALLYCDLYIEPLSHPLAPLSHLSRNRWM